MITWVRGIVTQCREPVLHSGSLGPRGSSGFPDLARTVAITAFEPFGSRLPLADVTDEATVSGVDRSSGVGVDPDHSRGQVRAATEADEGAFGRLHAQSDATVDADHLDVIREGNAPRRSFSNGTGACVEVAPLADGRITVRNSNHPGAGVGLFTRAEMDAYIKGVKAGEFDDLA